MNPKAELVIELLESNKVIDFTKYSQDTSLVEENYSLGKEFLKINPISKQLEEIGKKTSPEYIKEHNINSSISEKLSFYEPKNLEHRLNTQNPIIIFTNSKYESENETNYTNNNLLYRINKSNYPRQLAWYDISKPSIILPAYYKRH